MGLKLDHVVPWGRSLAEYRQMFLLTVVEMQRPVLDCGGGPASFNAELTRQGGRVVSCDPIYQFSVEQIEQRIQATYPVIVEGVRANRDSYRWEEVRSPEQLGRMRMAAMRQFLQDFSAGLQAGRYVVGELPALPFGTEEFSLALCSHLLFTYSDPLGLEFHRAALQELLRVATEVRIFPLIKIDGDPSPWLEPVLRDLAQMGFAAIVHSTPYEFQKGGNQLLIVKKKSLHCNSKLFVRDAGFHPCTPIKSYTGSL